MFFESKLSFKLTLVTVLIAFIIGAFGSLFLVTMNYQEHKDEQDKIREMIFDILSDIVTDIAFNLDYSGGEKILNSLIGHSNIDAIILIDDLDRPLASAIKNEKVKPNWWNENNDICTTHAEYVFWGNCSADKVIYALSKKQQPELLFGKLIVLFNQKSDIQYVLQKSYALLAFGILQSVLLAIVLSLIFYSKLTKPFIKISKSLKAIAKKSKRYKEIYPIQYNSADEIGDLAQKINYYINKNKQYLSERDNAEMMLRKSQQELETRVEERTYELNQSINQLKKTQEKLIRSERLAALGNMVAGLAHEINTPLGIGLTESSYLQDCSNEIVHQYTSGKLTEDEFKSYLNDLGDISGSIMRNLKKAARLIKNFKQLACDQVFDIERKINAYMFLSDLIKSLKAEFKNSKHEVDINCDKTIIITINPGVLGQILTNLILNSIKHGFAKKEKGKIIIELTLINGDVIIDYKDDGAGMHSETLKQIFDPFYTTRRNSGGMGLGMFIVYNQVVQNLSGNIKCSSNLNEGTNFHISIPIQP